MTPDDFSQIDQWFSNLDPIDSGKISRHQVIAFLGRFNLQSRLLFSTWNVTAKVLNLSNPESLNFQQFGILMRVASLAKHFGFCTVEQYYSTLSTRIALPDIKKNADFGNSLSIPLSAKGGREAKKATAVLPETTSAIKPEFCDTIFVGNLSKNVTERQISELFGSCGKIAMVRFATTPDGTFKGFGHVRFLSCDSIDAAIHLNGAVVNGRAIRVNYAPPSQAAVKSAVKKASATSTPASTPTLKPVSSTPTIAAIGPTPPQTKQVPSKKIAESDDSSDEEHADEDTGEGAGGRDSEISDDDKQSVVEEEIDLASLTPAVRYFIETCQACDTGEINRCFEFLMANEWPSCLRLVESMVIDTTLSGHRKRANMKSFITELALVHGEYYDEADLRRKEIDHWPETLLNISKGVRKLKSAKNHSDYEEGHKLVKQFRREFSSLQTGKKILNTSTCGLYDYTVSIKQSLFVSMQMEWNKMITKLEEVYRKANIRAAGTAADNAKAQAPSSPWDVCGCINGKKKVLIIGGTGSGKSTFINTLTNYFRNGTLDDMKVVIPTALHPATEPDAATHTESKLNDISQSQTQDCSNYRFKNPKSSLEFEFIDTPGIGDTRGTDQDEANLNKILTAAKDSKNLTAIVLVVNGRIPRLDGVSSK